MPISENWLMFDDLTKSYAPYRVAGLGNRYINPTDIIGFSLTENEILNSGKLDSLQASVKEKGWKPLHLADFHLVLLPDGKITVCSGGNHRAYLSKKLNLSSVKAYLEILLPESEINESTFIKINKLEDRKTELVDKVRKLTSFLHSKGSKRSNYLDEEKELATLHDRITLIENDINHLLLEEALILGYLSNTLFEGNL